jgi:hypothetical protein
MTWSDPAGAKENMKLAFDVAACGNGRGGIKLFYSYMPEIWDHRTLVAVCSRWLVQ